MFPLKCVRHSPTIPNSTTSTLTHTAARLESGLKKNLRGAGIASGGKFSQ